MVAKTSSDSLCAASSSSSLTNLSSLDNSLAASEIARMYYCDSQERRHML